MDIHEDKDGVKWMYAAAVRPIYLYAVGHAFFQVEVTLNGFGVVYAVVYRNKLAVSVDVECPRHTVGPYSYW